MLLIWTFLAYGLASIANAIDCTGVNAIRPQCASTESGYKRDVFRVGGKYVNAAIGLLTYDQIYVEKLTPLKPVKKPYPLVLFHGGGVSGAVSSQESCDMTRTS